MLSPINLQLGWPSPRLFPAEQLAAATTATLLDPEIAKNALIYGPDLGYTVLRESIAKWLSDFYLPSAGAIPPLALMGVRCLLPHNMIGLAGLVVNQALKRRPLPLHHHYPPRIYRRFGGDPLACLISRACNIPSARAAPKRCEPSCWRVQQGLY